MGRELDTNTATHASPEWEAQTAQLRLTYRDGSHRELRLLVGSYIVGREGDIRLHGDKTVSRKHLRLEVMPGLVSVSDLGSTCGTFDEDGTQIVDSYPLGLGESIRVGSGLITVLRPLPLRPGTSGVISKAAGKTEPEIPALRRSQPNFLTPIPEGPTR